MADPDPAREAGAQPTLTLSVLDDEGWFGTKFPEGVDELKFHTVGTIKGPRPPAAALRPLRRHAAPAVPHRLGVRGRPEDQVVKVRNARAFIARRSPRRG
jgi:hypothetical protein